MKTLDACISDLQKKQNLGYWGNRIISELEYLANISKIKSRKYDEIIGQVITTLMDTYKKYDSISKEIVLECENKLLVLSAVAKEYRVMCVSHAHIDMNWMWGFDETTEVALDTFRTMLTLMEKYPEFKFSQSQASVYKIVEEYDPEMLERIKERVHQGRWEVTASTWVENDKNMPNGESMSRHILYTKDYLSKLLDIDSESLNLDFEPDTFGHNINMPEILNNGGVKYYYHCRGYEGHNIYKWQSPSGKEVIVYREPLWYNGEIDASMVLYAPEFCTKNNIKTMLKVYGVGDHGGGPTIRDIERIIDMKTWPIFPKIEFGAFGDFFNVIEKVSDKLPVVKEELNFVFTGCYTSQSRIKMSNRISEGKLNETEALSAYASLVTDYKYPSNNFKEAWRNVLFNQFHDIIPGSGVIETREYAMGLFQKTMAIAVAAKSKALLKLSEEINTSTLSMDVTSKYDKEALSEGAGVGYGISDFKVTQASRGTGKTRIFNFFNTAIFQREKIVNVTLWDWSYNIDRLIVKDSRNNIIEHQVLECGINKYWGHSYINLLVKVKIPAMGYCTCTLTENEEYEKTFVAQLDPRVEKPNIFILENNMIKAVFDIEDGSIRSLIDKVTNKEFINADIKSGIFRLIQEDASAGMTAWVVGRYMNVKPLIENVKIKTVKYEAIGLRQSLEFKIEFGASNLTAIVSLDENSSRLNYCVSCEWLEVGRLGQSIPQLNFYMPLNYKCEKYTYDIPFGTIDRTEMELDLPGNSFVACKNKNVNDKSIMILTDCKYGYRGYKDSIGVTLIRSSFDPDPFPELGAHKFNFAICLVSAALNKELVDYSYDYNHEIDVISSDIHKGSLPLEDSFIELTEGSASVSAIKVPEGNLSNKIIIRLFEADGISGRVVLILKNTPVRAYFVDFNEKLIEMDSSINIDDKRLGFDIEAYSVASLCIEF